jgi:hypothetical protein
MEMAPAPSPATKRRRPVTANTLSASEIFMSVIIPQLLTHTTRLPLLWQLTAQIMRHCHSNS